MTEKTLDISQLIDQLLSPRRSGTLESSSAKFYRKENRRYDIEAPTLEGTLRFSDVEPDQDVGADAQSQFETSLPSTWIDAPLPEDEQCPDRPLTIDGILDRIVGETGRERRQAIIDAEAVQFHGRDRARLTEVLRNYIAQNRDSTDREELIAVSAAIRKCVALLDLADMGWLATLLEAGHRVQPSLDAELEIAKMVFRRYSQSPPDHSDPHPELSGRLAEIASDYLRPRVFTHERFSTVAMLATQALLIMRSQHAKAIIDQVNELPFAWFRQQLHRRMNKILRQMPSDLSGVDELRELIDRIETN